MKFGCDIDGVVTNLNQRMVQWAKDKYNKTFLPSAIYNEQAMGLTSEEVSAMFVPEFFLGMAPYQKNITALQAMHREGHELLFITSRPATRKMFSATVSWLHQYEVPADVLHFSDNKAQAAAAFSLDRFIEDFVDYANSLASVVERVYLIDQPYNQGATLEPGVLRVSNVNEVRNMEIKSNQLVSKQNGELNASERN